MNRKLYVTTKEFREGRILIGILTELNESNYQFEYKLGGKVQEWHLPIKEFPDVTKVYNGRDVQRFIDRMIPKKDSHYIKLALEKAGLTEYNTWEMLKAYGLSGDSRSEVFLYEKMPERIVMYEQLEVSA